SFDTDIYLARSDDGGLSFQPPVRVDDSGDSRTVQRTPSIAVDGRGYVYLAWQDARRRVGTTPSGSPVYTADIYLARSVDAGVSFTASVRVDDAGDAYVWHSWPSVAWSPEGILMVSWHDNRTGANSVYAANSRDGGQTFGQSVRMDDAPLATAQGLSSLSADHKGLFYSVWLDNRLGDWSIFSTRSVDGGISFKPNVRVDVGGSKSLTGTVPRLAAHEGGFLASVWTDWTPSLSDRDIYIAASRDRGVSFEGAFRVDQGPAGSDQVSPSVAVDEVGRAYVIWADDRNSPETDPHYDVYLSVLDFGLSPP
ncbi:MAG: hypothetical protein GTO63_14900, partial [Anaerolineae bacterium]|nr:hypothetical protein [Anaerolineae bacterium]NIN96137.1 hypothetical protein [Anaerolineae bacterium]